MSVIVIYFSIFSCWTRLWFKIKNFFIWKLMINQNQNMMRKKRIIEFRGEAKRKWRKTNKKDEFSLKDGVWCEVSSPNL
jgi:hypothetical protein